MWEAGGTCIFRYRVAALTYDDDMVVKQSRPGICMCGKGSSPGCDLRQYSVQAEPGRNDGGFAEGGPKDQSGRIRMYGEQ